MMCGVRRFPGLVATVATLVALVAAAAAPGAGATAGTIAGVRTLLSPAVVDAPGALPGAGLTEVMVHTLTDASVPGWAHIVAAGGTFTWEMWQPSDLIGDSMSHGWGSSALVAVQEILLGVALTDPDPDGTVRALVAPPAAGLSRASGSVPTVAGPIAVSWQRQAGGVALEVTVPVNTTAVVRLPATEPSCVRESGVPADRAPGVAVLSPAAGVAVLSVGSGTYRFTSA